MKRLSSFKELKDVYLRSKYLVSAAFLVLPVTMTLLVPAPTASASANISEYPLSSGYQEPQAIISTTGTNGALWYIDQNNNSSPASGATLSEMTTSGTITNYTILPSGATGMDITSIAAASNGYIWFNGTSDGSNVVGYFDPSTGDTYFHDYGDHQALQADAIAPGPNGDMWFTEDDSQDNGIAYIYRINSSGTVSQVLQTTPGQHFLSSLTAGPDNTEWATYDNNIYKFTVSPTTDAITGASEYTSPNDWPMNLTVGPDGNIWFIADRSINSVTPTGTFTDYTMPSGEYPNALTTGPDGALWFTDYATNSVGRVTTSGNFSEYSVPTSNSYPYGIVTGPDNALWFAEYSSGKIGRLGY